MLLKSTKCSWENPPAVNLAEDQKGASLIEFAISCPFLLLLVIGVVDCARLFNAYQAMNQIANNGVHMAATTSFLEEGSYSSDINGSGCGSAQAAPSGGKQKALQDKLRYFMDGQMIQSGFNLTNGSICIVSEYESTYTAGMAGRPELSETVNMKVSARFKGFLPFLNDLPISADGTGAYLASTTSDVWSGA